MTMMIVRYRDGAHVRWGRLTGAAPMGADARVELSKIDTTATTTAELIAAWELAEITTASAVTITIPARDLLSPVTGDASLVCQGLNYGEHAAEADHAIRKQNLFFAKASSSITGAYNAIERPAEAKLLDYEVEFGIVLREPIGRDTVITESEIGKYVAGVVLANDVSARDVMFGAAFLQWFQGKSYRTFCPIGPTLYLLERSEVADVLANLEIKLWVNGDLRQSANSGQLIFRPADTLAQLARVLDMKRGDVVLTGTPGGVTAHVTPKVVEVLKTHLFNDTVRLDGLRAELGKGRPFLRPGDVVTASLRDLHSELDLGGLENRVVQ